MNFLVLVFVCYISILNALHLDWVLKACPWTNLVYVSHMSNLVRYISSSNLSMVDRMRDLEWGLHHLIEWQILRHRDLELKVLKEVLQIDENSSINVLNYIIKRFGSFLNAYFAYIILLTIPVIIALVERSFSN